MSGQIRTYIGSNWHVLVKLMRNSRLGVEVGLASRIQGKSRMHRTTSAFPIGDSADIPERPSRLSRSAWDVGGIGLQEVDVVQGGVVDSAGQQGEEDEEDGTGGEEEGEEGEERSWDLDQKGF